MGENAKEFGPRYMFSIICGWFYEKWFRICSYLHVDYYLFLLWLVKIQFNENKSLIWFKNAFRLKLVKNFVRKHVPNCSHNAVVQMNILFTICNILQQNFCLRNHFLQVSNTNRLIRSIIIRGKL